MELNVKDSMLSKIGSILLIEDNQADVLLMEEAMSLHSIERKLEVMTDGQKAMEFLDYLEQNPELECPDLFVLDLNLPRRNGLEVLEAIRQSSRCSGIPVLVLSSSQAQTDRNKALELGANRYRHKASTYAEVIAIGEQLQELLSTTERRADGEVRANTNFPTY